MFLLFFLNVLILMNLPPKMCNLKLKVPDKEKMKDPLLRDKVKTQEKTLRSAF